MISGRFYICLTMVFLTGCSTVFSPYPRQMHTAREYLAQGQAELALSAVKSDVLDDNHLLKTAEIGRAYQWMGAPEGSEIAFTEVTTHVREESLQARIRMSKILSQTGSLVTNDNAIPYVFAPYETLLLYQYQALNYFAKGDISNAFVSIRQADQAQKWLREDQVDIQHWLEQSKPESHYSVDQDQYQAALQSTEKLAEAVKTSFDNPVIDYLSALMYQATGDYSNAIVSIRHALDQNGHPFFKQKLAQLLVYQANTAQETLLRQAYGLEGIAVTSKVEDATVVVWVDQGLVMPRQEVSVPIFLFTLGQVQKFSLPIYVDTILPPQPWVIKEQGQILGKTEPLLNIQALAARYLQEQMPAIIMREVARVVAKAAATEVTNRNEKINALGVAVQVMSLLTAHADLRSWTLLPQSIALSELHLAPGEHQLILQPTDDKAGRAQPVTLHTTSGSMQMIWLMQTGATYTMKQFLIK